MIQKEVLQLVPLRQNKNKCQYLDFNKNVTELHRKAEGFLQVEVFSVPDRVPGASVATIPNTLAALP